MAMLRPVFKQIILKHSVDINVKLGRCGISFLRVQISLKGKDSVASLNGRILRLRNFVV